MWIEHRPKPEESAGGGEEPFDLVAFSSYEVEEREPYLGETRVRLRGGNWRRLDYATVEVLVG